MRAGGGFSGHFSGIFTQGEDDDIGFVSRFDARRQMSASLPSRDAGAFHVKQVLFPDMLGEGGVKRDDVFAASEARPGTQHVGRIVSQWSDERDVTNFIRKRKHGCTSQRLRFSEGRMSARPRCARA